MKHTMTSPPASPPGACSDGRSLKFLRKKCADGLGEETFECAFDLLKRMQEGDGKVTFEGVEYDGTNDDEVRL